MSADFRHDTVFKGKPRIPFPNIGIDEPILVLCFKCDMSFTDSFIP
jgi:hypothetical protein